MNDLRTTSAIVNGATGLMTNDGGITSAPPRVRPERKDERGGSRKMSQRQSIVERARREAAELHEEIDATVIEQPSAEAREDADQLNLLDDEARERVVNAKLAERASRRAHADKGPNSRPARRRQADEPAAKGEDGFPWTFHLDNEDEPEELHASTPLLSRAFRASAG